MRLLVTKTKNTWTARQAHLAWEFKALVPKQIAAFCYSAQEVQETDEAALVKEVTAPVSNQIVDFC